MSVKIDGVPADAETTEDETPEAQQSAEQETPQAEADAVKAEASTDEGELVVTLGEAAPTEEDEKRAPDWLRDLRKSHSQQTRRLRELEAENARLKGGSQPAVTVGEKPKLPEFADAEQIAQYETELEAWHERKRQADEVQRQQQRQQEQEGQRWQARLEAVRNAAGALKVPDYDDASETFEAVLSPVQQGIILDGPADAKEAALLRYALGKNPDVAKRLAAISNPVQYAFAVAKVLYKDLNVKPKTAAPPPDRAVRSTVAGAAAVDSQLERLREKAAKTGDMSELMRYRAQIREKQGS